MSVATSVTATLTMLKIAAERGALRLEKPLPGFATLAALGEIPLFDGQSFDHQRYSLVGGSHIRADADAASPMKRCRPALEELLVLGTRGLTCAGLALVPRVG